MLTETLRETMRYCAEPTCGAIVTKGYCAAHAVRQEQQRGNYDTRRRYRTVRWDRLRAQVLRDAQYRCAHCHQVRLKLEIDHIVRPGADDAAFWNRANLQPLCRTCHQQKTAAGR